MKFEIGRVKARLNQTRDDIRIATGDWILFYSMGHDQAKEMAVRLPHLD